MLKDNNMIDLHTHSTFSDGSDTPSELIEKAKALGLTAVALTDHNTISGLKEFKASADEEGIEAVCGIELTTSMNNEDFHILALFIDPKHFSAVKSFVKSAVDRKIESNKRLIQNLINGGYNISYEEIVKKYGSENFNRVAIANELTDKGFVKTIADAFKGVLRESAGYYTPPKRLDTLETIKFIRSIGALPVWAHPLKDTTAERLDKIYLPLAKKHGLIAIEVIHSSYTSEQIQTAKALAKKHGLLESGGSDYHGTNKQNVHLATGTNGNVNVDDTVLQKLKNI